MRTGRGDRSLHCATPGFHMDPVALMNFKRLALRRAAHPGLSSWATFSRPLRDCSLFPIQTGLFSVGLTLPEPSGPVKVVEYNLK
jgi:hypothetical protein